MWAVAVHRVRNRKDYYYLVLGLTRHAAPEHIALAYQMEINQLRILQAHQNGSLTQEQKDRLAEINFAYSILGHAQRRKIYDTYGLRGVLLAQKHPTFHHSLWMIATKAWKFGIHLLTYLTCFWCGCCCLCGWVFIFCCRCCCNGCCGHLNEDVVCEVHHAQLEDYTVDGKTITRVKDGKKHSISPDKLTISSKYRGRRHSAPPAISTTSSTPHKERARLFIDQPQYSVKHMHQFKPACDNAAADILKKYNAPGEQKCIEELDMKKRANSDSKVYVKRSSSKKSSELKTISGSKDTISDLGEERIRSLESLKVQSTMMSSYTQPAPDQKTGSSTVGSSSCTSSNCKNNGKGSKHKKVEKSKKKGPSRRG
uniref:J domain-containing protein n=1 Tax=Bursaphelenchus xylophilus TaxID=6326 RepID=A0A1I7S6R8_BURXY